jgi:hypothetical protein
MRAPPLEEEPVSQYEGSPIPPPPPGVETPSPAPTPRRRTGLVLGAIAVVVALIAGAIVLVTTQGGSSAEAQPLALSFTEGQSETYEIRMTMDGRISSEVVGDQPIDMDMTQVVTWAVTGVDDEGIATVEVTTEEMSGTVNGIELPSDATAAPSIEFQVAPDGRIVSAGGLALGGAGQNQGFGFPGMGQLTPLLPDEGEEVAVGDTWEKDFSQDFPFGEGTIEFTATSTYERNETVDGREAAVIVTDMTVPMDFSLDFAEMIDYLGEDAFGPSGATGLDVLRDASIDYSGEGAFTQTSFVDLEAQEMLRMESGGDFDIAMSFAGIPGLDAGEIAFTGTFTQALGLR